jgi:hypothetical protein
MKNENPRRGGNAAGAEQIFHQQQDNIAPLLKFQPHNDTAASNAWGLETAMKRDRAFFKRHPFLSEYTREIMPGEFLQSTIPVPRGCQLEGLVKVERISPNVRKRTVLAAIVSPECGWGSHMSAGATEFLQCILPSVGPYVAWIKFADGRSFNAFASTIDELWGVLDRYDRRGAAVYHACARFKEAKHDPRDIPIGARKLGRTNHNVAELKSLS